MTFQQDLAKTTDNAVKVRLAQQAAERAIRAYLTKVAQTGVWFVEVEEEALPFRIDEWKEWLIQNGLKVAITPVERELVGMESMLSEPGEKKKTRLIYITWAK